MAAKGGYLGDSPYVVDTVKKYQRELSLLLSGLRIRKYHASEVVFLKGEVNHRFYFIKKGRVQLLIQGPYGTDKIMAIHGSNTFLADVTLDGYPNVATAVTLEESELYMIEKRHFESCVKRYPEVAFMVLESVARKARHAALQIGDLSLLPAKGRVAHILIMLSYEIGTETLDGITIQERITHETLAGLTGLARPTLTSVLSDFKRSNAITMRNHRVIIIDRQKLLGFVENLPE
jgi:CRP/FNR family transcriptional regulator, cyclic AMP receptor protein